MTIGGATRAVARTALLVPLLVGAMGANALGAGGKRAGVPKFEGAQEKSVGLAEAYQQVASELGCPFFDAGSVTPSSMIDGVHLDRDQHLLLGRELARKLTALLKP